VLLLSLLPPPLKRLRRRPETVSVQVNQVTLDARLQSRDNLRFTPAGLPVLDFALAHESTQIEAGAERRVACELAAVALGPIARELATVAPGASLRCRGFLARRYRTGVSVALHVNAFDLTDHTSMNSIKGN
jgi:primosomal replication protein N